MRKTHRAIAFVRSVGILGFLQELRSRVTTHYYERRLGVETAGTIKVRDLGFSNSDFREYEPIGYRELYAALAKMPLDKSQSTFLDYGSGKGRAVITAATLPFRQIIGIEISERLLAIAQQNLASMRHRRCHRIDLVHMDATQYAVPTEVNLIYFYNPFAGQVLQKVVDNIYASYQQAPREMYIVFFNNDHFEKLIKNQTWLTKIEQRSFYHHNKYTRGIYRTKASVA
jgi:16S rRNA G966 N2-methylase RsmD